MDGRQQIVLLAVFDHHPLGKTGRARGIDHIRQICRALACLFPANVRLGLTRIRRFLIQQQKLARVTALTPSRCLQTLLQSPLRQQHPCLRVLQHVRNPFFRILRVHRHIRRPRLQYPQQPHHHLEASLHTDRHQRIRLHHRSPRGIPHRPEPVRQLVGLRVQLRIRQLLLLVPHRHRFRRALCLLLEQLMDQRFLRILSLCRIEPVDDLFSLSLRQQRQVDQCTGIIGHHRRQQHLQVAQPALDRLPLEQRRAVLHHPLQLPFGLAQRQCQIEVRRIVSEFLLPQRQTWQLQLDFCIVLQRQHHLEQRAVAHAALRLHCLDHLLERHVLVPKPRQRALPDLRQQL